MEKLFLVLCLGAFALHSVSAHSYHLSECPPVEPEPDFNMDKFLGPWYVIQKTSSQMKCLINNFTKGEDHDEYNILEVSEHRILGLGRENNKFHYSGKLTTTSLPGRMKAKFSLNLLGSSTFTVFTTDYDSYAGIFNCQKVLTGSRRAASILSRTPRLDHDTIEKIREKLKSYGGEPSDLHVIKQGDCHHEDDVNLKPPVDIRQGEAF